MPAPPLDRGRVVPAVAVRKLLIPIEQMRQVDQLVSEQDLAIGTPDCSVTDRYPSGEVRRPRHLALPRFDHPGYRWDEGVARTGYVHVNDRVSRVSILLHERGEPILRPVVQSVMGIIRCDDCALPALGILGCPVGGEGLRWSAVHALDDLPIKDAARL